MNQAKATKPRRRIPMVDAIHNWFELTYAEYLAIPRNLHRFPTHANRTG